MNFLYTVPLLYLLLCASCGGRDFSVKAKPSPYATKTTRPEDTLDKTKMSVSEYRKKKRELQKARFALLKKPIKDMTQEELKTAKELAFADGNVKTGLRYLERIVASSTDLEELKNVRLEVADIYFELGDLEKAESLYNDFLSLYPGSGAIEYAEYKAILCSFYQTYAADFDQTKTKQTIDLSQSFLRKKNYHTYTADVATVKKECLTTLFDSEVNIINFYLDKDKLPGAQQRLASVKEKFSSLPGTENTILALEYELAKKQGNELLAGEKQKSLELIKGSTPLLAQHSEKKTYAQRF